MAIFLFASHGILSAPKVRPWLLGNMGRLGFYGLYSTVSLAAMGGFIWAYLEEGAGEALYAPVPGARAAAIALMPLVIFLIIGRVTTKAGHADIPLPPVGVYRISRHPGSVAIFLWAMLHLANVVEVRNIIVFVTMTAIAGAALVKNEWLRRRAVTQSHNAYIEETSIVPFLAILRNRQTLMPRETGWLRPVAALVLYGATLWLHPYILGVDPLAPFR